MADVEYTATLDDSQVLKSLKNIDKNMDKLANDGDKSFTKVGKSAKVSGAQIGAVSGVVQELVHDFINLAEQAARTFLNIAKGGVELNRQLELTRIALTNIFQGNAKAADAFIDQIDTLAVRLGVDFQELRDIGKGILPDIGDTQQTLTLMEQFVILGRDAGKNFTEIRRALEEAAAGQFLSLQRLFNIPPAQIRRIKSMSEEVGIAAALTEVLGKRVQDLGLDIDSIADTFEFRFSTIQANLRELQQIFGAPIFEALKEQATAFLEVFDEHKDDIERVAIAWGQFAADVVELIGTNLINFLDSIDYQQLEDAADALSRVVISAEELISVLSQGNINDTLGLMATLADQLAGSLRTAAKAAAIFNAEMARRKAIEESLTARGQGFDIFLTQANAEDRARGQEAFNQVMLEQNEIFKETDARLAENAQRTEDRQKATEEATDADKAAGDEIIREKKALEDLAAAEEKAGEAREKLSSKLADIALDRERKLAEIFRDQAREQIDDEIKFAQKREDLAQQNADKIEDIWRKHQDDLADAARDLTRDEEDIYRKAARDRVEADRDSARERLSVETDYRRELERIRARFNESAEEAERRNDAQAFLEAVRQRDRDITEAKRNRSEQLEDASQRAAEQRQKVQEQLQYEIEDARIANQRKLEDLRIRLERELEEQRINYARDVEEQALAEERKRAERQRANQQELEDFARKEAERLQDLNQSLATEFETIRKYEDLKREYRVESANRTVAEVNAALARLNPFGSSGGTPQYAATYGTAYGRQAGGPVEAGRPYIVGERGPELFVPARTGQIVPQVVSLPAPAAAAQIANDNSRRIDVGGINVGEDMFSSPIATRKLRNIVLTVLSEAL